MAFKLACAPRPSSLASLTKGFGGFKKLAFVADVPEVKVMLTLTYSPYPLDRRHKLNIHKMFRRHPERLPNVLCTFNLRPVSGNTTGCISDCQASMMELFAEKSFCHAIL